MKTFSDLKFKNSYVWFNFRISALFKFPRANLGLAKMWSNIWTFAFVGLIYFSDVPHFRLGLAFIIILVYQIELIFDPANFRSTKWKIQIPVRIETNRINVSSQTRFFISHILIKNKILISYHCFIARSISGWTLRVFKTEHRPLFCILFILHTTPQRSLFCIIFASRKFWKLSKTTGSLEKLKFEKVKVVTFSTFSRIDYVFNS